MKNGKMIRDRYHSLQGHKTNKKAYKETGGVDPDHIVHHNYHK
jgi:hypothetical protein